MKNVSGLVMMTLGLAVAAASEAHASDPTFTFSQVDAMESRITGGRYQLLVWCTASVVYNNNGALASFADNTSRHTGLIIDFGTTANNPTFDHCMKLAAIGGASTTRNFAVQILGVTDSNVTAPTGTTGYTRYTWLTASSILGCRLMRPGSV